MRSQQRAITTSRSLSSILPGNLLGKLVVGLCYCPLLSGTELCLIANSVFFLFGFVLGMLTFILWSLLLLHHQKFRLTWLHNNSNFSLPLSPPQSKDIFLYFVDCFISLITLMIILSYSSCQAWGWTSSSCQSTTSWWRWWCFRVKLQFGGLSCCLLCGISQNFPSNLLPRLLRFLSLKL